MVAWEEDPRPSMVAAKGAAAAGPAPAPLAVPTEAEDADVSLLWWS